LGLWIWAMLVLGFAKPGLEWRKAVKERESFHPNWTMCIFSSL
jgi:hypothetical protein